LPSSGRPYDYEEHTFRKQRRRCIAGFTITRG
jgi:hypothetical protein